MGILSCYLSYQLLRNTKTWKLFRYIKYIQCVRGRRREGERRERGGRERERRERGGREEGGREEGEREEGGRGGRERGGRECPPSAGLGKDFFL